MFFKKSKKVEQAAPVAYVPFRGKVCQKCNLVKRVNEFENRLPNAVNCTWMAIDENYFHQSCVVCKGCVEIKRNELLKILEKDLQEWINSFKDEPLKLDALKKKKFKKKS